MPDPLHSQIHQARARLASDAARNEEILNDVQEAVREGRSALLLTERQEHLDLLATKLGEERDTIVALHGGMRPKLRSFEPDRLRSIPADNGRVIVATGRFIDEGFDDSRLDTLCLAPPVSWTGTLVQYAGRLPGAHGEKMELRTYDYVDRRVAMLARMFEKRMRGYGGIVCLSMHHARLRADG